MQTISVRIIGQFDLHTGIGLHGWSFFHALANNKNLQLQVVLTDEGCPKKTRSALSRHAVVVSKANAAHLTPSDFSVFCDVLCNRPGDESWKLAQSATIRIAYPVWDSSVIPKEWVNLLCQHFDLAITPSEYIRHVVRHSLALSGIRSFPVLTLPLGLRYKKVPLSDKTHDPNITYGLIGALETRKNIRLLVEAFLTAFQGKRHKLRLHLSYSHAEKDELPRIMSDLSGSKVEISHGVLSEEDYIRLLAEIDCFVSMSMGEGFSVVPREFMALGKPVILSDSSAHREIPKMPGAFFVPAEIPYPATYPQIDGRFHGLQMSPYLPDVVYAFQHLEPEILKRERYKALQDYAETQTIEALSKKYNTIFDPLSYQLEGYDAVEDTRLLLSDKKLIEKYDSIYRGRLVSTMTTKQVVLANDGGFFSVFNRLISILVSEVGRHPETIVVPDWRISAMIEHIGHDRFTSFCYGTPEDGNIFLKLFEPLHYAAVEEKHYDDAKWLRTEAVVRTDYNESLEPNLTYIHAYKLYRQPDFQAWRKRYHQFFQQHIRPLPILRDRIEAFSNSHFDGYFVVAAHIRHPSHSIEQPNGRLPTVELFKEYIDLELENAKASQPLPMKVFIATDQESVIQFFKSAYGNRLVTTSAARTTLEQEKMFLNLPEAEQKKEGYQIQHIAARDKNKSGLKMAEEVIMDAWLLAKSNVFVHTTSNIATAVAYINPETKMVYCE